jgi:hypothetical protein
MNSKFLYVGLALLAYLAAREWEQRPVSHPPGILAPGAPMQQAVGSSVFGIDDYVLTRRARFQITARVLGSERYRVGREADLSPLDLALGWGVMSDSALLDQLEISQSGRWYHWRYKNALPVPEAQVIAGSSNMHMIPARKSVERALKKLRVGDIVTLQGYLVDADHPSGWHWRTSMNRTDSGNGACEIVYVESVSVATDRN